MASAFVPDSTSNDVELRCMTCPILTACGVIFKSMIPTAPEQRNPEFSTRQESR